jgi:hypothetical protein
LFSVVFKKKAAPINSENERADLEVSSRRVARPCTGSVPDHVSLTGLIPSFHRVLFLPITCSFCFSEVSNPESATGMAYDTGFRLNAALKVKVMARLRQYVTSFHHDHSI